MLYCKSHDAIWNTSRLWSHNRRGGAETIMSDSERGKTIPHEARGQFDQQNHWGNLGPRWFWIKLPESRGTRSRERFTIYTSTVHYWIISPTRWINILFRNFFISTIVCRVNVTQFMRLSQTERLWVILHCWQCNMTHNRSASSALWDIDIS